MNILDNNSFFEISNKTRSTTAHNNRGREDREMAATILFDSDGEGMGRETWIFEFAFEGSPCSGSYGEYFGHYHQLMVVEYAGDEYIISEDTQTGAVRVYSEGHIDPSFEDASKAGAAWAKFKLQRKIAA